MKNIVTEKLKQTPVDEQRIEIVERKGLGHPDHICDVVMNDISVELSKVYLKEFGMIMHHNIDKALLAAGEVENRFQGGLVKKPMLLVIGDRATSLVGNKKIPVDKIAIETAKNWFRKNFRFVNPEEHVKYQVELREGSKALRDIFKRKGKFLSANDTSAEVGYAPMTRTEKIVLETERFLNSKQFKEKFLETGEDVKIMGLRNNDSLNLTVAMAFVDKFIDSEETYFKRKEEILQEIKNFVSCNENFKNINVYLNTLDQRGKGMAGMYLTVLGTCADGADSGEVGRGNRVNGVIPLNRPRGSEAAAGKNPVSHVGKIYNVLSHHIANEIYKKLSGLKEVYVWLLSQIGRPIDKPAIASAQVILEKDNSLSSVQKEIQEIINFKLNNIDKFCMDLAKGKISIC
jgi:S-adenosylmethionine synthetase